MFISAPSGRSNIKHVSVFLACAWHVVIVSHFGFVSEPLHYKNKLDTWWQRKKNSSRIRPDKITSVRVNKTSSQLGDITYLNAAWWSDTCQRERETFTEAFTALRFSLSSSHTSKVQFTIAVTALQLHHIPQYCKIQQIQHICAHLHTFTFLYVNKHF